MLIEVQCLLQLLALALQLVELLDHLWVARGKLQKVQARKGKDQFLIFFLAVFELTSLVAQEDLEGLVDGELPELYSEVLRVFFLVVVDHLGEDPKNLRDNHLCAASSYILART